MIDQNQLLRDALEAAQSVLKDIDADWLEAWPEGPDVKAFTPGKAFSIAEKTAGIWRRIRSVSALLESAALSQPAAASQDTPVPEAGARDVVDHIAQYVSDHCVDGDMHADVIRRMVERNFPAHTTPPAPDHTEQIAQMVEIAGLESSIGHLSALVDDARSLLQRAMQVMKQLHESAQPDESQDGVPAVIPGAAFAQFVDAHAALMYAIANSPHAHP